MDNVSPSNFRSGGPGLNLASSLIGYHFHVYFTTGKQESVDATLAALEVVGEPLKSMAYMLVDVCAYAGNCSYIFHIYIHIQ